MGGKLVDEGEHDVLDQWIKRANLRGADSLYLGLYDDTTEPLETATLASGISELSKTGYARIQITDANWTITADQAVAATKTFTAGEDWGNVYGYFICNIASGTGGLLLFVESFSTGAFNIANTKTLDVTAKITAA